MSEKMYQQLRKIAFSSFALALLFGGVLGNYRVASAAIVNDNTLGIYSDDFADATGIAASSDAGVDIADGTVKLKNEGGTYTAPYLASGTVTLTLLRPLQVAKWGMVNIIATTPPGTSIKVQAMDDNGNLWRDEYLSGNSTGVSSFPADMSGVPIISCAHQYIQNVSFEYQSCFKNGAIQFKFTLATSDSAVTPVIDSVSFNWALTQGDNSPTTPSSEPWSAQGANQQATFRSPYANAAVYPAVRWASAKYNGDFMIDSLYVVNGHLFGWSSFPGGWMFGMDKDTGAVTWRIPFSRGAGPAGLVAANGVFYGTDYGNDQFYAVDTTNGQIRWTYQFYGGHGSSQTAIGPDGTIYTVRGMNGAELTVYAFNSDGTIKWTKALNGSTPPGTTVYGENISIDSVGRLYFGYYVIDTASGNYLNLGKVYSLDPVAGDIRWTYDTGDVMSYSPPLIDDSGTVYIGNYNRGTLIDAKLYAIRSDGSLKWAHDFGAGSRGVLRLVQKTGGNIIVTLAGDTALSNSQIIEINKDNGTVVRTLTIGAQYFSFTEAGDANDGIIIYEDNYSDPDTVTFGYHYYDQNLNFKWQVNRAFPARNVWDGITYGWTTQPVIDERGWMFSSMGFSNYDGAFNWYVPLDYAQVFALAPWTLANATVSTAAVRGGTITFSATTSMLATNPLNDEANQVQAVLDTGVKVPLTHPSTNSDGNTVWTGEYSIPDDMALGAHTYTIEANAAMVKTDINTAFASPATGSENTGLTAAGGSFEVQTHRAPVGGGGGSAASATVALNAPNGGATYAPGQHISVSWSSANAVFTKFKVSYSANNGAAWTTLADAIPGTASSYDWTVPSASTAKGLIKVEGLDASGTTIASDTSASAFAISGASFVPPATDPTVSGDYDKDTALANNPNINTNMGLTAIASPACASGMLVKGSFPAVYYCGADGKRHVFPNERVYFSWYDDWKGVTVLSDEDLAEVPIGANVTYRPGSRLVKILSDPKVYAISRGGVLRWLKTEAIATRLYGAAWNKRVDYIPDAFFVNYTVGDPITE